MLARRLRLFSLTSMAFVDFVGFGALIVFVGVRWRSFNSLDFIGVVDFGASFVSLRCFV